MSSNLDSRLLGNRLRLIRIELFGRLGIINLAWELGIPPKTWNNYELGVTMPADILVRFVELTSVDPHWLATGDGPRFLERSRRFDLNSAKEDENRSSYASRPSDN